MLRKFLMCAMVLLMTFGVQAKGGERTKESRTEKDGRINIKYDGSYNDVVNYLYSFHNHRLTLMAHCESYKKERVKENGRYVLKGRYVLNARGDQNKKYPVYGILQFQQRTFDEFARRVGMHHPNRKNSYQQIYIGNWMINHGYIGKWSCYAVLKHFHRL